MTAQPKLAPKCPARRRGDAVKVIRFIYAYRLKATGRAVYVGSAFDVAGRDREHYKGHLPFDKEIRRVGRDAFTLKIVEALRGVSAVEVMTACIARENQWMDVLDTFRTKGCFNFSRAVVTHNSEEQWEATKAAQSATHKKRWQNSEVRARNSAALKKRYEDPEERARTSAAMKIAKGTPEARARNSAAQKKRYENPEARARTSAAQKKRFEDPEERARTSAALKKRYEDPEERARTSATHSTPEARARTSAAIKKYWASYRAERFLADALISAVHATTASELRFGTWSSPNTRSPSRALCLPRTSLPEVRRLGGNRLARLRKCTTEKIGECLAVYNDGDEW